MRIALIFAVIIIFFSSLNAGSLVPDNKKTAAGLYLLSKDAYKKWKNDPDKIKVIDVRTQSEYIFVGHPEMAVNIPLSFLRTSSGGKAVQASMHFNREFANDVMKRFKTDDTIFVICRSGNRSAAAVNILYRSGFKKVYNIYDGFEGDRLKKRGDINYGKRVVNGWRNSALPWTYSLNPELVYKP